MTNAGTPYWADFLRRSVCMEYTYVETSYALMATLTCVQKINQVLFLLYIFLVYFNYSEHNYSALRYFLYAGELFITKWCYATEARLAVPRGFTDRRVMVRFTSTRRPTRPSAPHYSATDDSPARPRDWFTRPHRLTTRRTICSSAPAYNAGPTHLSAPAADSPVSDFSFT